jgi:hypothetical protein
MEETGSETCPVMVLNFQVTQTDRQLLYFCQRSVLQGGVLIKSSRTNSAHDFMGYETGFVRFVPMFQTDLLPVSP